MPAKKLAELAAVSEATIHRLVQALEYSSYKEMQLAIKESLFKQRAISRLEATSAFPEQSLWIHEHYSAEMRNIEATRMLNAVEDVRQAAGMLLQARHIWVGGWRMGLSVTAFAGFILKYLLGNAELIPQGQTAEYATYLQAEDVLLVSGFPRYCHRTLKLVEIAKQRGLMIIVLTDSHMSPFAKYGNVNLFAPTKSISFLDSYTAPLALFNAVLREMALQDQARIQSGMRTMEQMFEVFEEQFNWSAINKP